MLVKTSFISIYDYIDASIMAEHIIFCFAFSHPRHAFDLLFGFVASFLSSRLHSKWFFNYKMKNLLEFIDTSHD